jgi:hypothetical protein
MAFSGCDFVAGAYLGPSNGGYGCRDDVGGAAYN